MQLQIFDDNARDRTVKFPFGSFEFVIVHLISVYYASVCDVMMAEQSGFAFER